MDSPSATRVQASIRTPESPVLHRNKPPRWSDAPAQNRRPAPARAGTGAAAPPVWQDKPKKDPNITNCDDCGSTITLGESAFAHGNGTYCRACLCGTCGKPFGGLQKNSEGGLNYCPDCVCRRCNIPIGSQYVPSGNGKICLNCSCDFCRKPLQNTDVPPLCADCKCHQCRAPLNGKYYPKDDGSRLCESCSQNTAQRKTTNAPAQAQRAPSAPAPLCQRCGKPLSGTAIECNNKDYHIECFKCVDCGKEGVHLIGDLPYCETCHPDKECCCVCGSSLRGGGLEALGRLYHTKCFTCQRCYNPLPGGKFKEIDNFALCNHCASEIVNKNLAHE